MMEMKQTDSISVDEDTALELMVYHLQMAHIMFQNTPDGPEARDEAQRLFLKQCKFVEVWQDDGGLGHMKSEPVYSDSPEIVGGMQWFDHLTSIYEEMKKADPDE